MIVFDKTYYYDIRSAHVSAMKHFGYDVSKLEELPKVKRNIEIGNMCRDDSELSKKLIEFIRYNVVKFVERNSLDILMNQYDGVISCQKAKILNPVCDEVTFVEKFSTNVLVIIRKDFYFAITPETAIVRGVQNKSVGLEQFFFECFKDVPNTISSLRSTMLLMSERLYDANCDVLTFGIPRGEALEFVCKGDLTVRVKDPDDVSCSDIDTPWYHRKYLNTFIKEICKSF